MPVAHTGHLEGVVIDASFDVMSAVPGFSVFLRVDDGVNEVIEFSVHGDFLWEFIMSV